MGRGCRDTRVGPRMKRSGDTRPDAEPLLQRTFNIWKRRDEKRCVPAKVHLCGELCHLRFLVALSMCLERDWDSVSGSGNRPEKYKVVKKASGREI